jgi:Ca2+-binding RTX toxin-like protein
MKRAGLLLVAMTLALLLACGVALAANKLGGDGPDSLIGTSQRDIMRGGGGNDFLDGKGGPDTLLGETGNDDIFADVRVNDKAADGLDGGKGNDILVLRNNPASGDVFTCGPGKDTAFVDVKDQYFKGANCERLLFRQPRPSDF